MSPETQYLLVLLRGHLARVREDERGVSAVEWVIITGLLIALAGGVGWAISTRVQGAADRIAVP